MGIRLAQALHHGTDHRSQICTALTTLSWEIDDAAVLYAEVPDIDGRRHETATNGPPAPTRVTK